MLHCIVVNAILVRYRSWAGVESNSVFVWFAVKVGVLWVHCSPPPFPPSSQEVHSDLVTRCRSVLADVFHSDWYMASPLTQQPPNPPSPPRTCRVNVLLSVWTLPLPSRCLTDALTLSSLFWEQLTVWVKDQPARLPFLLLPAFAPVFHPTQTQQPSLRSSVLCTLSSLPVVNSVPCKLPLKHNREAGSVRKAPQEEKANALFCVWAQHSFRIDCQKTTAFCYLFSFVCCSSIPLSFFPPPSFFSDLFGFCKKKGKKKDSGEYAPCTEQPLTSFSADWFDLDRTCASINITHE